MPALDKEAVKAWLEGQRAASRRIEVERRAFLAQLTTAQALDLYLALQTEAFPRQAAREPSRVLLAMRQLLARRGGFTAAGQ